MQCRVGIPLVLLLFFASAAAAQLVLPYREIEPAGTFSILVTPERDKIEIDQWAEFTIVVRNHQMQTRRMTYGITEEGVEFSSLTQPTADLVAGFLLEGGSVHTTHYQLKPNRAPLSFSDRPYEVMLVVTDVESGERHAVLLPIWVYPKGYYASQQINMSVALVTPEHVDPRNTYAFRLELRNNNDYDIGPIIIRLAGKTLQRELQTTLGPNAQQTLDFSAAFEPQQQPVEDAIAITVVRDGIPILRSQEILSIVGYRIPFEKTVRQEKRLLKRITTITLTNKENVAEEQEVLVETTMLQRLLSRVTPEGELVTEGGKSAYRWKQSLGPGEQLTITITTSYRMPALIAAALFLAALFWYLTKDPVAVLKYAEQYRMFEGGITELKVALSVKNRTRRILRHVQLVDKVPSVTHVREGENFGTLRPHRMVHGKDGTMLKWDIDHMEPDEERIITYVLRAKLSIIGNIRLPPAMAIIAEGASKAYVKSNEADVTSSRQVRGKRGE